MPSATEIIGLSGRTLVLAFQEVVFCAALKREFVSKRGEKVCAFDYSYDF